MFTLRYSTLSVLALLAVTSSSVLWYVNIFIGESNGSTALTLLLNVVTSAALVLVATRTKWREILPKWPRAFLIMLLGWNAISLVRGAFAAPDYWTWKALVVTHLFALLMPIAICAGLHLESFKKIHRALIRVVFPIAFLLIPLNFSYGSEMFQRAVVPIYLALLVLPYVSWRWRLFLIAVAFVSIGLDISYRANVIRVCLAVLLAGMGLLRVPLPRKALNWIWRIALALPLFFLALGISGRYDVFRDGLTLNASTTTIEGGVARESSLDSNTRSFIYDEVFLSMRRRGSSFLLGQGSATGYDSAVFAGTIIGSSGRNGSEVGFLNTLINSGLVGIFLYAAMLLTASYYAFNRSRNYLSKLLGLFLLFKWSLFFVEDIPWMDLNFFVTWMMVGLCLSNQFRALDDAQVGSLLREKWVSPSRAAKSFGDAVARS